MLTQPPTHTRPLTLPKRWALHTQNRFPTVTLHCLLEISPSFVTPKGFSTYLKRENKHNLKLFNFVKEKLTAWHFRRRDSNNDKNMTAPPKLRTPCIGLLVSTAWEGACRKGESESLDRHLWRHLGEAPLKSLTATDQVRISDWSILPDRLGMPLTHCINDTNQFKFPKLFLDVL